MTVSWHLYWHFNRIFGSKWNSRGPPGYIKTLCRVFMLPEVLSSPGRHVGIKDGIVVDDGGATVNNYSFQALFVRENSPPQTSLLRKLPSQIHIWVKRSSPCSHDKGQIFFSSNLIVRLQPISAAPQKTLSFDKRRLKLKDLRITSYQRLHKETEGEKVQLH